MMTPPEQPTVAAEQFFDLDMRVGRVLECETFPGARQPAYRMLLDFGELGQRRSSARLTDNYTPEQLIGTLVVAVVNLPPRQIGPVRSEVLVLGAYQHGTHAVAVLRPDGDCQPGDRIG
ncbi:MAG: tRNA-binding protein [Candidatus Dormibacteraeota bacterium]|nr:tRNA-binding protein [Candidatus Dormibacteraeota bacterium]